MNAITDAIANWSWGQWAWAFTAFLVTLVGSLAIVAVVLIVIPSDFFVGRSAGDLWRGRHPLLRWGAKLSKNLLGFALVVVGIALSVPGIPGQGLLTVVVGLALVDFPGKRRVERAILGRPKVIQRINRLRARFRRPPLIAPTTLVYLGLVTSAVMV